jgi:hypothetical protein
MLRTIAMLLLISTGALASPRKLMIAGDSHCDHSGVGYNTILGTWRKEFQDLVAAAGYQVDYVGGTPAWGAGNCAPNQLDCDNACYNGASLLTMDVQNGLPGGSIPTQLGILKPDDLLLMGGNNEIPLYAAPVAAQHLRDLLLHNWAQSPSTRTFLAKPTDTCNGGQRTGLMVPFNALVDGRGARGMPGNLDHCVRHVSDHELRRHLVEHRADGLVGLRQRQRALEHQREPQGGACVVLGLVGCDADRSGRHGELRVGDGSCFRP